MKKNKKDRKRTFRIVASLMLTVLVLTGSTFAWFTNVTNVNKNYANIYDTEGYVSSQISSYEIVGSASVNVLKISETGERSFTTTLVPMMPTSNYSDWRSGEFTMKKQDTYISMDTSLSSSSDSSINWDTNWDINSVPGSTVNLFTDSNVLSWSNSAEVVGSGSFKFRLSDETPSGQLAAFIEKDGRLYAEDEIIPEGSFNVYVYLDGSVDNSSYSGNDVSFKITYEAVDYEWSN